MKNLLRTLVRFVLLLSVLSPALAQQINPTTQIRWPLTTGSGSPTSTCSSANHGQPYTDITANIGYTCTPTGWVPNSNASGVILANSFASLNAAAAACTGQCTIAVNAPISLSANLVIPSSTTLLFNQPGLVNLSGHTLTDNGPLSAGPYQIFNGTGVTLGNLISEPDVEWFGAVADWNGSTGTDNTASIQSTINALTAGQAVLQTGSYRITGPLRFTVNSTGIKGQGMRYTSGENQYPNPAASILVNTTAGADSVDLVGTSPSDYVGFGRFNDFNIERSVLPTGTAAGFSMNFTYGVMVQRIGIQDSVRGFYIHGSGSQGNGFIEDVTVQFGSNGITETSGNYYGFYLDSSDGIANPSLRLRHSFIKDQNLVGPVVYGMYISGSAINDLMTYGMEMSNVNYCVLINQTALGNNITSSDIHMWGTICDGFTTAGWKITNLAVLGSARVELNGGYAATNSTNVSAFDIENSSGVEVSNMQIGASGTNNNNCVFLLNDTSINISNNLCQAVTKDGIITEGTTLSTIMGNTLIGQGSVNGLIRLIDSSTLNAVVGNTMTGSSGQSLVIDSTSVNNTGIDTDTIGGSLSAAVISGSNPLTATFNGAPTGACANGSFYGNSTTTTGTYPYYLCRNTVWVGQGTVY